MRVAAEPVLVAFAPPTAPLNRPPDCGCRVRTRPKGLFNGCRVWACLGRNVIGCTARKRFDGRRRPGLLGRRGGPAGTRDRGDEAARHQAAARTADVVAGAAGGAVPARHALGRRQGTRPAADQADPPGAAPPAGSPPAHRRSGRRPAHPAAGAGPPAARPRRRPAAPPPTPGRAAGPARAHGRAPARGPPARGSHRRHRHRRGPTRGRPSRRPRPARSRTSSSASAPCCWASPPSSSPPSPTRR